MVSHDVNMFFRMQLLSLTKDQINHCQHDYRADKGNQQTGQVESGHALTAKKAEHPAANTRTNDTSKDVRNYLKRQIELICLLR